MDETKVAFDVDGTLIYMSGENEDTPRYDVIAMFHMFEKLGFEMHIWSGGGMEYAERWARKLGLKAKIINKACPGVAIDIAVDDEEVLLGEVNLRV